MKDGERERPIEHYGKKEQKEWLENTLLDPHPCTAGNKEGEHMSHSGRETASESDIMRHTDRLTVRRTDRQTDRQPKWGMAEITRWT